MRTMNLSVGRFIVPPSFGRFPKIYLLITPTRGAVGVRPERRTPLEPYNIPHFHTIRLCKPRGKLQNVARRSNGSENLRICRRRDVFPHIHHLSRTGKPEDVYGKEHVFHPKPVFRVCVKGKQHSFVGGKTRSPAKTLCSCFRSGNY